MTTLTLSPFQTALQLYRTAGLDAVLDWYDGLTRDHQRAVWQEADQIVSKCYELLVQMQDTVTSSLDFLVAWNSGMGADVQVIRDYFDNHETTNGSENHDPLR